MRGSRFSLHQATLAVQRGRAEKQNIRVSTQIHPFLTEGYLVRFHDSGNEWQQDEHGFFTSKRERSVCRMGLFFRQNGRCIVRILVKQTIVRLAIPLALSLVTRAV
jgi:hypothetical protein